MDNSKFLVSVVVPVYNAEKYLSDCIDSLMRQTRKPEEIILVDDGSTDCSGEICDLYASQYSYIKVIHKQNGGVSSARNAGIDAAQGKYLIFVDADDLVDQRLLEFYAQYCGGDGVPICNIKEVHETEISELWGKDLYIIQEYTERNFMQLFSGGYINSPCNKLYFYNVLNQYNIRFPENMDLGEDLFFNLDYLTHVPLKYYVCHEPLYYYRQNMEESLSRRFYVGLFELQLQMFQGIRHFLEFKDALSGENKVYYLRVFWDRLYLTLNIYKEHEIDQNAQEISNKIKEMLKHSIWKSLWLECKKERVITYKMLLKKLHIDFLRMIKGY